MVPISAPVDVFLAYNERDKERVRPVAEWLSARGISNHFFDRDLKVGDPIDDIATMESAHAVLVFLGEKGWGPNHMRITEKAMDLNKSVYPLLIGDINDTLSSGARGLFASTIWLDLRNGDLDRLGALEVQLRRLPGLSNARIEGLLSTLAIGTDSQRQEALQRIIDGEFQDRDALASVLLRDLSSREARLDEAKSGQSAAFGSDAGARSWLRAALVWCRPEHPATRDAVVRGLDPGREPAAFVRFWTLAAVAGTKASYLDKVARGATADPAPDVAFLARTVLEPASDELLGEMRAALAWPDLPKVHGILRALRVEPIPALAEDVASLLKSQSSFDIDAYEVFCALATPRMAVPGALALNANPGLESVVGRMALSASSIDNTRAENFARLLMAMDARRAETLLREREREPIRELSRGASVLRRALAKLAAPAAGAFRQMPGFAPDTIAGQPDQLEIQSEVNTLTAIMMAKEVTPPLAIGLFGEWGTGKSFFMSRMKETVRELMAGPALVEGSPFCANAVQIHFNAWHYADTSLWASLVSSIFESLDAHLQKKHTKIDERQALLDQLAAAERAKSEARAAEEAVRERLKQEQERLAAAEIERERKLGTLSSLRARDVADLLMDDDELKTKAESALKALGLPAVIDGMADLRRGLAEAHSLRGRALAMWMALSRDRAGRLWFALFLCAMAASPVLIYLIHRYLVPGSIISATLSTIFVEIVAFAGSAAALLHRGTTLFGRILAPLEDAKKKADEKLAEKRKALVEEEESLRKEVSALEAQEADARARLDAAVLRTQELEKRLQDLELSRTLAYFVSQRRGSTDYSKHLGLVSVVRQDFELLVERINKNNLDKSSEQKLERIILYIDDLDRCPADKVVEVLQAVHLLLAYPLFVVVVGVDARWLLNSLTLHYKELGVAPDGAGPHGKDGKANLAVSPQHYLEKIFQIPYALRPMSRQGYGRLVSQLMGDPKPEPVPPGPVTSAVPENAPRQEQAGSFAAGEENVAVASETPSSAESQAGNEEPAPHDNGGDAKDDLPFHAVVERALVIQPWEVDFAQRLYGLVPSPRSAKRLINVYRVLKAGVDSTRLNQFEGSHDAPGEFQVPLLLLAVMICDTGEANLWFAQLVKAPGQAGARTLAAMLLQGQDYPASPRARFIEAVTPIVDAAGFPKDPSLLAYWVPRVARFSFHAWHGALEE